MADLDGDEEADPVAGQQHPAEQQAARILTVQALPARAGDTGEQRQGEHGESGAAEHDDHRAGAGCQLAEYAGQAKEQRADMQGAEGGAVVHDRGHPRKASGHCA